MASFFPRINSVSYTETSYRYVQEHLHKVPVEPCGGNFMHSITEPLVKERPKSDIVLKYNHFLVAICQNLRPHHNTITS